MKHSPAPMQSTNSTTLLKGLFALCIACACVCAILLPQHAFALEAGDATDAQPEKTVFLAKESSEEAEGTEDAEGTVETEGTEETEDSEETGSSEEKTDETEKQDEDTQQEEQSSDDQGQQSDQEQTDQQQTNQEQAGQQQDSQDQTDQKPAQEPLKDAKGKVIKGAGWHKVNKKWYYTNAEGIPQKGFTKVGKKTYLLDSKTGAMQTGWQKVNGTWYSLDKSGAMQIGWQNFKKKWYYFDAKSGAMATGFSKVGKYTYYFGGKNDGSMKSGWRQIKSKWYNFGDANDGAMQKGWFKDGDTWYYLQPKDGVMAAKTAMKVSGKLYSFAGSGAMHADTNVRLADNVCGYAASNGVVTKIGVYKGKKIILKKSGKTVTGWQKYGKTWFCADKKGVMFTGWIYSGGCWYYMQPKSGAMSTGSCKVGGTTQYFESNGVWNKEKTNMVKRAQRFSSNTNYLILVDTGACRMGVFKGSKGKWNLIRYEKCVCGAPGSSTITGTYSTGYHLPVLPSWSNALHCTNISGGYFFHSILNSTSELGHHLSHGCVRLNWPTAIYIQTLPYGSTVNLY